MNTHNLRLLPWLTSFRAKAYRLPLYSEIQRLSLFHIALSSPKLEWSLLATIASYSSFHQHFYQSGVENPQLIIMAPNWTLNRVDFPRLTTQPPSKAKSRSLAAAPIARSQGQLGRT